MKRSPVLKEAILPRIDGIQKNVQRLESLSTLPPSGFIGDNYDLAQHHLRLALEGIFHISSHILSRIPGGRVMEYKEIAKKMGELNLIPKDFANRQLLAMAGMRNLLVHNYSEIIPKKLKEILDKHLSDISTFLGFIKEIIKNPKKFGILLQ